MNNNRNGRDNRDNRDILLYTSSLSFLSRLTHQVLTHQLPPVWVDPITDCHMSFQIWFWDDTVDLPPASYALAPGHYPAPISPVDIARLVDGHMTYTQWREQFVTKKPPKAQSLLRSRSMTA